MSRSPKIDPWGTPPWKINFTPSRRKLPAHVDFAIIGGGFTGLAAAGWLRLLAPDKSVAVFEAAHIGAGASGRTGGMVLAETAAGNQPGLGDVLAGFQCILEKLKVRCDLKLNGAWEIARRHNSGKAKPQHSPITWNDSGTLRVVNEVPGGTLDPGKLVSGLARAAQRQGAYIYENHRVQRISWSVTPELHITTTGSAAQKITAAKILFATNALSLPAAGLTGMHPRLTLAVLSRPVSEKVLAEIGLGHRKPFYTVDFPYLWGRVRPDRSIVWGAGLVQSPDANDLEKWRSPPKNRPQRSIASKIASATCIRRWKIQNSPGAGAARSSSAIPGNRSSTGTRKASLAPQARAQRQITATPHATA